MQLMTIQDLTKECLKLMDEGNANKYVMVSNDNRFESYHPLLLNVESNKDKIIEKVNTSNPQTMVLIG